MSADRPSLPKRTAPALEQLRDFAMPMFWWVNDAAKVVSAVKEIFGQAAPGRFFGDNLLTWGRNMSMLDDEPFVQAWRDNAETDADKAIIWRRYVLACAGYHCVQLEGDFVECGAYAGVGVKTVVDYLGGASFPKTFWAYDVFEHDETMLNHSMPKHGPDLYPQVCAKFAGYPQVKIIRGLIPEVLAGNMPERVAYLHIDLNQAAAEIAALEHLFDRMSPGGILILDDYEWSGVYRKQKLAEDPWFDARGYRVMPLPTGQGLVIKR